MQDLDERPPHRGGIAFGLMLVLLGVMLVLNNTGLLQSAIMRPFWSFIPIGFGIVKMFQQSGKSLRDGTLVLFGGIWLLLNDAHIFWYLDSWPLLIVAWGAGFTWDALASPEPEAE
jgi:cell wall-active antibiotic response 4TMS protein YvqF